MGCSVGTVKSTTSRALERLRRVVDAPAETDGVVRANGHDDHADHDDHDDHDDHERPKGHPRTSRWRPGPTKGASAHDDRTRRAIERSAGQPRGIRAADGHPSAANARLSPPPTPSRRARRRRRGRRGQRGHGRNGPRGRPRWRGAGLRRLEPGADRRSDRRAVGPGRPELPERASLERAGGRPARVGRLAVCVDGRARALHRGAVPERRRLRRVLHQRVLYIGLPGLGGQRLCVERGKAPAGRSAAWVQAGRRGACRRSPWAARARAIFRTWCRHSCRRRRTARTRSSTAASRRA